MIGTNAIRVYLIIIEFIEAHILPVSNSDNKSKYTDELLEKFVLAKIADEFILKPHSDPIKIFDAVKDAYSTKYGIENFIEYREILEADKLRGFTGLSSILEKRKRYYCKKSSVN